ncbi:hypothetical protein [Cupriavidus sp. SK-3]|uniref:hypothetical protein n=1 Tax=Cupriavidus sp. SK-3 TaxID=1470558 RepID=UPI001267B54C|nr:hypothetical protein [Cupriavidus sp. SK-3]
MKMPGPGGRAFFFTCFYISDFILLCLVSMLLFVVCIFAGKHTGAALAERFQGTFVTVRSSWPPPWWYGYAFRGPTLFFKL